MPDVNRNAVSRWSRKRRIAAKLALVVGGLIAGLVVAETALRVAGYSYPVFYITDLKRGYALKPNAEGWYRKESKVYIRINRDGLRDREHVQPKPVGTLRIAVIGDSYAEALQVPQENAFWAVMETELQACQQFQGRPIDVINFGVSGYGTAQELITLRERVWDYAPDIVLLAVTTNNDITDNSRALKKTDEIPYFIHRDGRLVLDDSFRATRAFQLRQSTVNEAGKWVRDHLRVIQAIHEGHGAIKAALAARRAPAVANEPVAGPVPASLSGPAAAAADPGIDNMIYRPPGDAIWQEAWRITEELVVLMRDEVRARKATFFLVTLSNGIQVHPDRGAREAFARRVGATDLFYPDLRLKALAERENFPILMLAPELQAYAEQHRVFLHGFGRDIGNGHWNETGHRIAGELLARWLCEQVAPQRLEPPAQSSGE